LAPAVAFVRAGGFFENFLYGLHVARGGTLPVYYDPTDRKSTMVATNDIGAEIATLLIGPAWSGQRVIELGSMVSADEVAVQLGEVMKLDVKAFALPRAAWPGAFEQLGIPKGQTGAAEAMFDAVNADGWISGSRMPSTSQARRPPAIFSRRPGKLPRRRSAVYRRDAASRTCSRNHGTNTKGRLRLNMKILVLGATGGAGRLIVSDAAAKGHSVVALVRSTAGANLPKAELIEGGATDEIALRRALAGCDAVVSALGTGMVFRKVSLLTEATRALVPEMTRSGARRLVCISALGVGDSRGHGGFVFDRLFQPLLLSQAYKDKDGQEAAIRASQLDWVIVRPGMLTDDPARGRVRAVTNLAGISGGKISRADVARFVVDQLTSDTWLRRTPVILW
jgi:uncharacterized protein YbjT (DUF2867 family)